MDMFNVESEYTFLTECKVNGYDKFEKAKILKEDEMFLKISYKNNSFVEIVFLNKMQIASATIYKNESALYIECLPTRYENESVCFTKCTLSREELEINSIDFYKRDEIEDMVENPQYQEKYKYVRIHNEGYWSTSTKIWYEK